MASDPRALVEQLESAAALPDGSDERFSGYGVMGLPFRSGHVLAMRRFPASSLGLGYTAVWHRNPKGDWVFYANVPARESCARYFGAIAEDAVETDIAITWTGPVRLRITMPAQGMEWDVEVAATVATRLMNGAGAWLPAWAWRSPAVLTGMEVMAGPLLGVGHVGLQGHAPNGQHFIANPRRLWAVISSRARLAGEDFGAPGPVTPQARLGDFWIPQRGMLAIGQAYFDTFDPTRHTARIARSSTGAPGPGTAR